METNNTSIQWGKIFERGYASISATTYKQRSIDSRDRRITINADGRNWGGADNRSSATPAARITLPDETTVILSKDSNNDYLTGTSRADYQPASDEDLYNFAEVTTALLPHEHKNIQTNLQLDFDNNVGFFLETSYDTNFTQSTLASTPIFTAFENTPITISADNIFNIYNVDISDIRRRIIELKPGEQQNKATARHAFARGYWLASCRTYLPVFNRLSRVVKQTIPRIRTCL